MLNMPRNNTGPPYCLWDCPPRSLAHATAHTKPRRLYSYSIFHNAKFSLFPSSPPTAHIQLHFSWAWIIVTDFSFIFSHLVSQAQWQVIDNTDTKQFWNRFEVWRVLCCHVQKKKKKPWALSLSPVIRKLGAIIGKDNWQVQVDRDKKAKLKEKGEGSGGVVRDAVVGFWQ